MSFTNKIALAIILVVISITTMAQQMPELPLDPAVRYGKLPNGLTYYIRHNEEPRNQANFYIAQMVGAIQEEDDQRGLAHFLEHMAFNGSVTFPADGQLVKACERMGVKFGENLNAYTACDETVYNIADVPTTDPANIDTCLWILHDWSGGLLLTEEEIQKERGVIHEEWRMRSNATQRILNKHLHELYPGSRYGYRMPIGLMEIIDNFHPDFLRAYYKKWYRPDLQGIIIVGDVNIDEIEQKIKNIFTSIPMPENAAKYEYYPVPDNEQPIYVVDKDKEMSNGVLLLNFKSEPLPRELRGTLAKPLTDYVTSIICAVVNERFADIVKNENCPFVYAGMEYEKFIMSKTCDAFGIQLVPKPGLDAQALQVVMQELSRVCQYGLTETEISRARIEMLSQLEKLYDNRDKTKSSYYINKYVRHFLEGDAAMDIATEYEVYKMLSQQYPVSEINNACSQLINKDGKNFILLGLYPDKDGVEMPSIESLQNAYNAAMSAQLEAFVDNVKSEPLIPVLPTPVKIKKEKAADYGYTCWTLSNGARVFFKQTDFNNSEVIMSANSWGGMSLLPQNDLLNASMACDVMNNGGWGAFTSSELDKALAGKQANVSVGMTEISEMLSGRSTPKDLRTLFELTYLKFQEPKDDPDAYRNLMDGLRIQMENQEKLPMKSFQDSIQKAVYGENPRHIRLKLADLDKIDYKECKRIYMNRFSNVGDFDFYFTGAFNTDSLRLFVEQYIAPLQGKCKREKYNKKNTTPIVEGERTIRYNRTMETPQAFTMQLWSGNVPYSIKNDVTVEALGAALDQMLLKSIREDGGMAYSVSAKGAANFTVRENYSLQIYAPFTPEKVDSVLLLMQEGIDQIARNGVSEKHLDDYKQFELKQFEERQRQNAYWQMLISTKNEWGRDQQKGVREAIESVTSDDIKRFANDILLKQHNTVKVTMLPSE